MNYLAHLFLAEDDTESLVGSLMGDFHRGGIARELSPALRRGVLIHRRVDSFTDAHPVVRLGKARISPEFRRYAGILLDLFYDHFLARQWTQYAAEPLDAFAERVYAILRRNRDDFPAPMQRSMDYMVRNELLQSYRTVGGIERSLHGIEGRLSRPSRLHAAIAELERNYQVLEGDFELFFPDLIRFTEELRRSLEADTGEH